MFFRYGAAVCAVLYGLLRGYIIVLWSVYGWYHFHDLRWLLPLVALSCGISVFMGAPVWWAFGAMALVLAHSFVTYPEANWLMLSGIVHGVWQYSKFDIVPFASLLLPLFGMIFSLSAEGRLRRSIHYVRHWPYHKGA
jgi:hypothetical protein